MNQQKHSQFNFGILKFKILENLKSQIKSERGSMLILSALVLAVVAVVGLSVVKMTSAEQMNSVYDYSGLKASYIAQAGLENAMDKIYHGDDPVLKDQSMLDGSVTVSMMPSTKTIIAEGKFGNASKKIARDTQFAAECFSIDFGPAKYKTKIGAGEWSHLSDVNIKKNCNNIDTVKIKEMRLLYSSPQFTKLVKHIGVNDDTSLYHVPSNLVPGYPQLAALGTPNDGAQSKQAIDVTNYALNDNEFKNLDIWWNTSFLNGSVPMQVQVIFVDGSVFTSEVKNLP